MKDKSTKDNSEYIDVITSFKKEITRLNNEIKEINLKINKKEDDIKNILNEKDIMIKGLNNKILEQEIIIQENRNIILNLNKKIEEVDHKFMNELIEKDNKINENINDINNNILKDKKYLLNELDNKCNELKIMGDNINNQLTGKINDEINLLKEKNDNYITLKINIEKSDIGKKIKLLNQCKIYKYFNNFELNDIIIIIDDNIINLQYDYIDEYKYDEESKNCDKAQRIYFELETPLYFYYEFSKPGIHLIKINFKKELKSCENIFRGCNKIFEINLSHFNCSYISSCESMFDGCYLLKKINFGLLDFSLVKTFKNMFYECKELIELDVSKFDTKNSITFESMFEGCINLQKIDVSKFNSSKCEQIGRMFMNCKNITEIDMLNWNLSNLKEEGFFSFFFWGKKNAIDRLFSGCKKIKIIKLNTNFNEGLRIENIFDGIPGNGTFIYKKGNKCNIPLKIFPLRWNKFEE